MREGEWVLPRAVCGRRPACQLSAGGAPEESANSTYRRLSGRLFARELVHSASSPPLVVLSCIRPASGGGVGVGVGVGWLVGVRVGVGVRASWRPCLGRPFVAARSAQPTYHFAVQLVEMNFAHFINDLLVLECYKTETCLARVRGARACRWGSS